MKRLYFYIFSFFLLFFALSVQARVLPSDVVDALEYAYDIGGPDFSYEYNYALEQMGAGAFDFPEDMVRTVCVEALQTFYRAQSTYGCVYDSATQALERELLYNCQNRAPRPPAPANNPVQGSPIPVHALFPRDLEVARNLTVGGKITARDLDISGSSSNLNVANLQVSNHATIEGLFTAQDGYYFNSGVPGVMYNVLQVTKGSLTGPNQFNSIRAAVESISDASSANPYVVLVGPGLFIEDTITLKPFVSLVGYAAASTIVMAGDPSHTIIVGSDDAFVSDLFLFGSTGLGASAITFTGDPEGHLFVVNDCSFGANYRQLSVVAAPGYLANILIASCSFVDEFVRGFHVDGTAGRIFASVSGILWDVEDSALLSELGFITGPQVRFRILSSCFASVAPLSADGFVVQNGANVSIESSRFYRVDRALYVPNIGAGPEIFLQALSAFNCTQDIRIDNPLTQAVVKGIIDWNKTVIDPSASVSLAILDPNPSAGIVTVGMQQAGGTVDTVTNITPILEDGSSLGVISGGNLSVGSGLQVEVSAGTGYIAQPSLAYVEWNDTTLTLPANTDSFIYVDQNGDVVSSAVAPSSFSTILIGKARTNGVLVAFIQQMNQVAEHTATQLDGSWRGALGPVYSTGSLVTKNGDVQLDVSSGWYFFSTHEYSPIGGTAISWEAFYRNGSGNYYIVNQNTVDYNHYDDSSGVLATIPVNNFARHALYVVNDGVAEKYLFVYAQETYATLLDAQNGVIPSKPGSWTGNIALIASIIVKNSAVPSERIAQIRDERPTLGFKSSGTSVTNIHGDLLGLTADDHHQYLLVNGTRAMADSLDMGGYSITNVDLVDSVDVSLHGATRHIPNGLDPLPTAVPVDVGTSNQVGIQNSFARSDHVHNHGTLAGGDLHDVATHTVAGFMSAADKTTLDGLDPSLYVQKAGDSMTGTLNITAAGSNALVVNTDKFVVDSDTGDTTVGGTLDVSGQATLSNLSTGIVHSDASGVLTSSSIVNADIDNAAAIADTKLATISTAGKVSNTATTATSALGAHTIVARDGSNNFSAGTITANLTGSVTGAASLNVLKAGDTMSGDLNMGGNNISNINLVDGVDVPAHASRHNPGGADALALGVPVSVGTVNQEGSAASFARSDHVHNHGDLAGGSLHADATTSIDGFMSAADKTKLDGLQPGGSYVLKAGDSMTGTLNITAAGSNALVVNTDKFVVDSNTGDMTCARNIYLADTTDATTGIVYKNSTPFLHNRDNADPSYSVFLGSGAGNVSSSGASLNVGVGYNALTSLDTGYNNVVVGPYAADALTSGFGNTFLGYRSGSSVTGANYNVAIGQDSLVALQTGANNVAIGVGAVYNTATSVSDNIGIGREALGRAQENNNIAIGSYALAYGQGNTNIAIGPYALGSASNVGDLNIAIGYGAGDALSSGSSNVFVGIDSGGAVTTGVANTFVGNSCGGATTTGDYNIGIGYDCLSSVQTGAGNVAMGVGAMYNTGAAVQANVALGREALGATTSDNNVAVGYHALRYVTSPGNVAVGSLALSGSNNTTSGNTVVGYNTMSTTYSSAIQCVALGSNALAGAKSGSYNCAIGYNALTANTDGASNVALGHGALSAVGYNASNNIAIGKSAGDALTSGTQNLLCGTDAGGSLTTASDNVLLGYSAGSSVLTGTGNIIIGSGAQTGSGAGAGYNEIVIGQGATGIANDTIVIGNTSHVACYIQGIDGVTVPGGTTVYIDSNGQLGTSTSSRRFKENIEDIQERDDKLMELRPVKFTYISDQTKRPQYGLIAEEVEEFYPELVSYDKETGLPRGVLYDNFISLLMSRIQRQESRIERLESVVRNFLKG